MNVPSPVINAARNGLILAVSPPDPLGRIHKWRIKLTDAGFLLTSEDGVRYLMPIIDGDPEMIREDLIPALHYYLAAAQLRIQIGDERGANFFATRLVSIIQENPSMSAGWFDPDFLPVAKAGIVAMDPERYESLEVKS